MAQLHLDCAKSCSKNDFIWFQCQVQLVWVEAFLTRLESSCITTNDYSTKYLFKIIWPFGVYFIHIKFIFIYSDQIWWIFDWRFQRYGLADGWGGILINCNFWNIAIFIQNVVIKLENDFFSKYVYFIIFYFFPIDLKLFLRTWVHNSVPVH